MPATRLILLMLMVLCTPTDSRAQAINVAYEGTVLPPSDPIAPWTMWNFGGSSLSAISGVLHLMDATSGVIIHERQEPAFASQTSMTFEARVGVVQNDGSRWNPCFVLFSRDPTRPAPHAGRIFYPLSFYSDRIEFRRHFPDGTFQVLATVPVPDLATSFHVVRVNWLEAADRKFRIVLDGVLVASIDGESTLLPLDVIAFGHDFGVGPSVTVGRSQWDYFRYWSEDPTATDEDTWGRLKALYRR